MSIAKFKRTKEGKTAGRLIIISGPSGVGKDAVFDELKREGYPFHFVTTATTRPPRQGEVNGRSYYFFSEADFLSKQNDGFFIESACVYGNYYGIPKTEVECPLNKGITVITKVDVQGAATLKSLYPDATAIFIKPPSRRELEKRLSQRNSDSEQSVKQRVASVPTEMRKAHIFDYTVVNHEGKLTKTVEIIKSIISRSQANR